MCACLLCLQASSKHPLNLTGAALPLVPKTPLRGTVSDLTGFDPKISSVLAGCRREVACSLGEHDRRVQTRNLPSRASRAGAP
jgi:hypothetical protein